MTEIDVFILVDSEGGYFVCHDEPAFEERIEAEMDEDAGRAYRAVRLKVRIADFAPRHRFEREVRPL
jgi:hypothetical protein